VRSTCESNLNNADEEVIDEGNIDLPRDRRCLNLGLVVDVSALFLDDVVLCSVDAQQDFSVLAWL